MVEYFQAVVCVLVPSFLPNEGKLTITLPNYNNFRPLVFRMHILPCDSGIAEKYAAMAP
jgi:hypothetical protein